MRLDDEGFIIFCRRCTNDLVKKKQAIYDLRVDKRVNKVGSKPGLFL